MNTGQSTGRSNTSGSAGNSSQDSQETALKRKRGPVPAPDEPHAPCFGCVRPMTRREGERPSKFRGRKFCSHRCAARHSAQIGREAAAEARAARAADAARCGWREPAAERLNGGFWGHDIRTRVYGRAPMSMPTHVLTATVLGGR